MNVWVVFIVTSGFVWLLNETLIFNILKNISSPQSVLRIAHLEIKLHTLLSIAYTQ